jgi:hypothetical protein
MKKVLFALALLVGYASTSFSQDATENLNKIHNQLWEILKSRELLACSHFEKGEI